MITYSCIIEYLDEEYREMTATIEVRINEKKNDRRPLTVFQKCIHELFYHYPHIKDVRQITLIPTIIKE